jgi:hypothetical protein
MHALLPADAPMAHAPPPADAPMAHTPPPAPPPAEAPMAVDTPPPADAPMANAPPPADAPMADAAPEIASAALVGRRVVRRFRVGRRWQNFRGIIDHFEPTLNCYHIEYEDGDGEDLEYDDAAALAAAFDAH